MQSDAAPFTCRLRRSLKLLAVLPLRIEIVRIVVEIRPLIFAFGVADDVLRLGFRHMFDFAQQSKV